MKSELICTYEENVQRRRSENGRKLGILQVPKVPQVTKQRRKRKSEKRKGDVGEQRFSRRGVCLAGLHTSEATVPTSPTPAPQKTPQQISDEVGAVQRLLQFNPKPSEALTTSDSFSLRGTDAQQEVVSTAIATLKELDPKLRRSFDNTVREDPEPCGVIVEKLCSADSADADVREVPPDPEHGHASPFCEPGSELRVSPLLTAEMPPALLESLLLW